MRLFISATEIEWLDDRGHRSRERAEAALSVLTDCENERSHHCDPTRFEVLLMKIFMSY